MLGPKGHKAQSSWDNDRFQDDPGRGSCHLGTPGPKRTPSQRLQTPHRPVHRHCTLPLLRRQASYLLFKALWWGLLNSCLHSLCHSLCSPIPRFLLGWGDLLSWAHDALCTSVTSYSLSFEITLSQRYPQQVELCLIRKTSSIHVVE